MPPCPRVAITTTAGYKPLFDIISTIPTFRMIYTTKAVGRYSTARFIASRPFPAHTASQLGLGDDRGIISVAARPR